MDDNKSKQERLFLQTRELCRDNIEDELRLVGAKALDMSQYSILGDETYTLDYIPRINMSTPRGDVEDSEFMKRHILKTTISNNVDIKLIDVFTPISMDNTYNPESLYTACLNILELEALRVYHRCLPVQNKFIFALPDGKYLILTRGKLSAYNFRIFTPVNNIFNYGLFRFIDNYIRSTIELVKLRSLRKRIKIKRIKKR